MKQLLLTFIISSTFGSLNAQNVNIPDANFKAYLVGNTAINTNLDTEIQVSEANAFAGAIDCSFQSISDLTGIEKFTALTELQCVGMSLTSLDVSQNFSLEYLDCSLNQISALDVSQNTLLNGLLCSVNQIASIDISQNPALTTFECADNQLSSLDLSQNASLYVFHCGNNLLTCLNLKNGNNTFLTWFSATNNPSLTCIEVDDVTYSNSNWLQIDAIASFSTDCNNACSTVGIEELNNTPKQLLKIVDLMGRETAYKPNTVLIYMYSDGTTERVFMLED